MAAMRSIFEIRLDKSGRFFFTPLGADYFEQKEFFKIDQSAGQTSWVVWDKRHDNHIMYRAENIESAINLVYVLYQATI